MALAYKGLSLSEQGKISDALKYFKKALLIDKNYDLAQKNLDRNNATNVKLFNHALIGTDDNEICFYLNKNE